MLTEKTIRMMNAPFLTLLDPRAKIKGSRDPLGLQILWTKLGRQVVYNLTTVTTSLRGFTVLLLGLYFAERAIAERQIPPNQLVELFLKFEQLAAYSRVVAQTARDNNYTEDEIRGIQRVKKNLLEKRVWISADSSSQILANQKTYGLWGLYMVAARNSQLIESELSRLTPETRTFILAEYDNQKRLTKYDSEQIIGLLCKDQWFEPIGRDSELARKLAGLFGVITPLEKSFYKKHLLECGDIDLQAALWQGIKKVTRADESFSMNDLQALRKYAQTLGRTELIRGLAQIQIAESVFGPAAYMFNFMLARDGQTIERIANEIKRTWGARVRSIDPTAFAAVLETVNEQADIAMRTRLAQLATSLAEGNYRQALELLIIQNQAVMQARGGSAWVTLKGQTIAVGFKENTGALPTRDELSLLWTNTYFLNALKTIGYQIDGDLQ